MSSRIQARVSASEASWWVAEANWSVRRSSSHSTNVSRARLWGLSDRRARLIASRTSAGRSSRRVPSTVIGRGESGARWRSRTARRRIVAHTGRDFTSAVSADSAPRARTPGTRSASVVETTPVSPSEGSTCST